MLRSLLLLLLCFRAANAETHHCLYSVDFHRALKNALPGDEILLHPGNYRGNFYTYMDGEENNPITIRSSDLNNNAVIDGQADPNFPTIGLYIVGNHWSVQDIIIQNANKGVIFDAAVGGELLNCVIRRSGEEAVHVRDGSSNILIEGNYIHSTGIFVPGWGEGIYVGSDKGHHEYFDPTVSHVTIRDNVIGPLITAEGIDVREGTHDVSKLLYERTEEDYLTNLTRFKILIERNTFDASGLMGHNSADSFIDLKGTRAVVRYNIFNQHDNAYLNKGVNIIDRDVDKSAYDHVIAHNTFNMETRAAPMVRANQNTENIYAFDNTRSPSGTSYGGSVISDGSTPFWYIASQAPIQMDMTPSRTIFSNKRVNSEYWINHSSGGFFLYDFNDGAAHQSAIYAQLEVDGKVYFESHGADLTGLKELRFFVRSMTPDTMIRMKVNGIAGHFRPDEEWIDHSLPFALFIDAKDVNTIMFENTSDHPVTLLFDDIRFTD